VFGVLRDCQRTQTTATDPGTLPRSSRPTIGQSTRRLKPNEAVAAIFVAAANKRSVPTATDGDWPNSKTSMGVIIEPPPTPVRPTRLPTRSPAAANMTVSVKRCRVAYAHAGSVWCRRQVVVDISRMKYRLVVGAPRTTNDSGFEHPHAGFSKFVVRGCPPIRITAEPQWLDAAGDESCSSAVP
jgi:hypothetical protein